MAKGTNFKNPAYEPAYRMNDDDDDCNTGPDETQRFFPGSTSTPGLKKKKNYMQTMKH